MKARYMQTHQLGIDDFNIFACSVKNKIYCILLNDVEIFRWIFHV